MSLLGVAHETFMRRCSLWRRETVRLAAGDSFHCRSRKPTLIARGSLHGKSLALSAVLAAGAIAGTRGTSYCSQPPAVLDHGQKRGHREHQRQTVLVRCCRLRFATDENVAAADRTALLPRSEATAAL